MINLSQKEDKIPNEFKKIKPTLNPMAINRKIIIEK